MCFNFLVLNTVLNRATKILILGVPEFNFSFHFLCVSPSYLLAPLQRLMSWCVGKRRNRRDLIRTVPEDLV